MSIEIIAEIAQAHDGSLGILHSYIDALASTGVTTVKFQTHIAEAESSEHEPFRKKFSYVDKTRFDYWKRMEFSASQWKEIKDHCEASGMKFLSSPFSMAAVHLLESLGMKRFKLGSGEITNLLMVEYLASKGHEIILSSGMSSWNELDNAVQIIKKHNSSLKVLQCTTAYPTQAEQIGLNVIQEITQRYQCPSGLSDHSGKPYALLAATALGAKLLEFHVTFDRRIFGPDSLSSLSIDETKALVDGVKFIDRAINNPVDKNNDASFVELKNIFGKSLATNKDLPKGHVICFEDLETKKPGDRGIAAKDFKQVIGKITNKPLNRFDFISQHDIT